METEGAISSEVEKEIVNPDKNVSAITPGKNVPKAVENSVDTSARKTSDALCSKYKPTLTGGTYIILVT